MKHKTPSTGNSSNEPEHLKKQATDSEQRINSASTQPELFSILLDTATDWIYWRNSDGSFNYVSPACETITGYSAREFTDHPQLFEHILHPEDRRRLSRKLLKEFRNPQTCSERFRIISKSGEIRWIWHQCNPIYDQNGTVIGRSATNRDITRLHLAEEQRAEQQQMLRTVFDAMPDPIHMIDRNFRIVLTNRKLLNLKNLMQEEIRGKYCYQIYRGRKKKCHPCAADQTFQTGEIASLKSTRSLPDGSKTYFQVFAFPVKDNNKSVTHVIEVTRDITEQTLLEEALKRSRDQYLHLANSAPLGILSCNRQGVIMYVNPAMLNMLGSPSAELTRRYNVLDFDPLKKAGITSKLEQTLKTGRSHRFETVYTSNWGKELVLRIHISPIRKPDNTIDGALGIVENFTEQSRLQKILSKSEKKFHDIFEYSPNGILLINTSFRIVDVNRNLEEITGYAKQEIVGQTIWDFNARLTPAQQKKEKDKDYHRAYIQNINHQLTKNTYPVQSVTMVQDKNGHIRYFQEYWFRIQIDDDSLLVNLKNDVTVQYEAQKALKNSEERFKEMYRLFRLIADNDPDMLWAKDLNGRFMFTNKAICERLLGAKDVNEPVGKDDLFFANRLRRQHPEDPQWHNFGEAFSDSDKITLKARKSMQFEEYGNVMGKFMFLDVRKAPLRDEQGRIIGIVGSARDVTEEKELEKEKEAMQREVTRMATVIEQADVAIIITDTDGNMQYVNRAFELDTGYSRKEALGQTPRILKSGEHPIEFYEELWATITSGKTWHGTIINKKKDGTVYHEDAIIFPIFDAQNKITNYAGILRDITKEKELEKQIQQMQKMESIAVLTGGIAHDFNNLLTVINGYTDLGIAKYGNDLKIRSILSAIQSAGNRAAELTSQLLAFSRKQIISPKIIDINKTILGLEKMLKRIIEEHIALELFLQPHLPTIKADPVQIEQILMNLIVNARDALYALPENELHEKRIQVETKREYLGAEYVAKHQGTHEGDYISIAVSDNGIGMEKSLLNKIFDPFFTTKEVGKGTGLGLSTVYGIVKQNNGNIYVYSEPGKGTTIKIYWPVCREKAEQEADSNGVDYTELKGNETILLVEDDRFVREVGRDTLEEFGYRVITAKSGTEALALVKKENIQPQLLITDLVMPSMSGKELSVRLKEIFPSLKIIFASGYTENHIVKNGVLQEGIHFIQKPYQIVQFVRLVRQVLDAKAPL